MFSFCMYLQNLCAPMLGYVEFLHSDWLDQVLSWQGASGCYGETKDMSRQSKKNLDSRNRADTGLKADSRPLNHDRVADVDVHRILQDSQQQQREQTVVMQKKEQSQNRLVFRAANGTHLRDTRGAGNDATKQIPHVDLSHRKNNVVLNNPSLQLRNNEMLQKEAGQGSRLALGQSRLQFEELPHMEQQATAKHQNQVHGAPQRQQQWQDVMNAAMPNVQRQKQGALRNVLPNYQQHQNLAVHVPLRPQELQQQQQIANQQWWQQRDAQSVKPQPYQHRRLLFEKDLIGKCSSLLADPRHYQICPSRGPSGAFAANLSPRPL